MQILKVAQFHDVVNIWATVPAPFVDFESNGKETWDPAFRITCLSLTGFNREAQVVETIQIPLSHQTGENAEPGMMDALASFFSKAPLGAFWVQMEASSILSCFKVRSRFVDDPYIALRIYQDVVSSLKEAVAKHLGIRMATLEEVLGPGQYDFSTIDAQDPTGISYSEADSIHGFHLARFLEQKLIQSKMQAVYQLEVAAAATMAEQTFLGYEIDLDTLERELDNEEQNLIRLEETIFSQLGCQPFKLNSGPKLSEALLKIGLASPTQTKSGKDSWAMPVMEGMIRSGLPKEHHDVLTSIMEWKSRFSTRNTLRKSPTRVSIDGRIHPVWKSIGFDGTARMYAENPSITSLPPGARRAMKAPKGKRWMKFDWKQAELRALAAASQDKGMIEALNSSDFHKAVYSKMADIAFEEVTKDQRETSKIISFSILYSGGSAYHVARALGVSMEEATQLVRDYLSQFSRLRDFLDDVRSIAIKTYHVRTFMNRVRRLNGDDEHRANQASDAIGQQSIGTCLKIALQKMIDFHQMKHPCMKGLCQIIPVFDAIFYCIDDDIPVAAHLSLMRDLVQLNIAGVILEAEFEMGRSWGDLKPCAPDEFVQAQADLEGGAESIQRNYPGNVPRETISPEQEVDNRSAMLKGLGLH